MTDDEASPLEPYDPRMVGVFPLQDLPDRKCQLHVGRLVSIATLHESNICHCGNLQRC
jgi:hypothetical protein